MADPNLIINALVTVLTKMSMRPNAIPPESYKAAIIGIVAFLKRLVLTRAK
jgi:hypothetical protein